MIYDQSPDDFGAAGGITIDTFKTVYEAASKVVDKSKIVIGMEPGKQTNGGQWEGVDTDKKIIDWAKQEGMGGVMFWAMNGDSL
jgi:GH18 family chitinase